MTKKITEAKTFTKEERLCNKIVLDKLFTEGKTAFSYPLKFIFIKSEKPSNYPVQVVFSVPKRSFKRAVKRNLLRRRMKEAFRLNKTVFYNELETIDIKLSLMIIYSNKEELDYSKIEKGMIKGLQKTINSLK